MRVGREPEEPIKVLLHDNGEDVETVWAIPVRRRDGGEVVRLDNVPFLHAKPTYGDVIEVRRDESQPGFLSWNSAGRDHDAIIDSLVEDGVRYTLIVDYTCPDPALFAELTAWAKRTSDLECEGLRGPAGERPGRLYVAALYAVGADAVLGILANNLLGFRFELIHPR